MSRTDHVATGLVRLRNASGPRWVVRDRDADRALDVGLAQLLAMPLREARDRLDSAVPVPVDGSAISSG